MMGLYMMRKMNPKFLNQSYQILENNNDNNSCNNNSNYMNLEDNILEYETIDAESNPLNKYIEMQLI